MLNAAEVSIPTATVIHTRTLPKSLQTNSAEIKAWKRKTQSRMGIQMLRKKCSEKYVKLLVRCTFLKQGHLIILVVVVIEWELLSTELHTTRLLRNRRKKTRQFIQRNAQKRGDILNKFKINEHDVDKVEVDSSLNLTIMIPVQPNAL